MRWTVTRLRKTPVLRLARWPLALPLSAHHAFLAHQYLEGNSPDQPGRLIQWLYTRCRCMDGGCLGGMT